MQQHVPQIDIQTAIAYRSDAVRVIANGTNAEKKRLLSMWVDQIKLAPETLEVEIHYRIPEPVVDRLGAPEELIANYPPLRMPLVVVKKQTPLR